MQFYGTEYFGAKKKVRSKLRFPYIASNRHGPMAQPRVGSVECSMMIIIIIIGELERSYFYYYSLPNNPMESWIINTSTNSQRTSHRPRLIAYLRHAST